MDEIFSDWDKIPLVACYVWLLLYLPAETLISRWRWDKLEMCSPQDGVGNHKWLRPKLAYSIRASPKRRERSVMTTSHIVLKAVESKPCFSGPRRDYSTRYWLAWTSEPYKQLYSYLGLTLLQSGIQVPTLVGPYVSLQVADSNDGRKCAVSAYLVE